MSMIRLSGVGRAYGDRDVPALDDVDLSIDAGDFVAVVGPSGSGKSTLLNILGLLDRPDSGRFEIAGIDVDGLSAAETDQLRARRFGFVFQRAHLIPSRSVLQNVMMPMGQVGVPTSAARQRAHELLSLVGVQHLAGANARTLSGGEQQRVAIARGLALEPDVILADEPTGSLDRRSTAQILGLLRALSSRGTTVIVVTHDPEVAAAANRTVQIADGRIESDVRRPPLPASSTNSPGHLVSQMARRGARARALLADALEGVFARPSRAALVIASFALGAGALTASVGLGETAANQVSSALTDAALDQVYVIPPVGTSADGYEDLMEDLRRISVVEDVGLRVEIAPADAQLSALPPHVRRLGSSLVTSTIAASSSYLDIADYGATQGSWTLDDRSVGRVALVGQEVAAALDYRPANNSRSIWVSGVEYRLVGVLHGASASRTVALSGAPEEASLRSGTDAVIVVQTIPGYPARVADFLGSYLPPGAEVATVANLDDLRLGIEQDLSTAIAAIAVVVLLLAMLGAATTIMLSVHARAGEIALRRAVGAARRYVGGMFLLEGVLLGLIGGAIGSGLGVWAAIAISQVNGWAPALPSIVIPLGVCAGAVTGLLASTLPAHHATGVAPAVGLRQD